MSDVEAAARRLVGSRFRLHGRDPATGLDCVGVLACATGLEAPTGYALRGGDAGRVAAVLDGLGLERVASVGPGDVVLMRVGPGQLHLGVRTGTGLVHADAGLRRVVERAGEPEWEVLGIWRRSF
jgi:murein DD-endopeptidase / murein LD-carboxypeptidase